MERCHPTTGVVRHWSVLVRRCARHTSIRAVAVLSDVHCLPVTTGAEIEGPAGIETVHHLDSSPVKTRNFAETGIPKPGVGRTSRSRGRPGPAITCRERLRCMSAEGLEQQTQTCPSNNVPRRQDHSGHFEVCDLDEAAGGHAIGDGREWSGERIRRRRAAVLTRAAPGRFFAPGAE